MEKINVVINEGKAELYTPYNSDFVKKIKQIGSARWNPTKKCWAIDAVQIDVAREIMKDVYGFCDIEDTNVERITLKLTFEQMIGETTADLTMFGKVLSHAYGRDSGAKAGDDVAYLAGGPTSGGSSKNWASQVKAGSVAMLYNVSKEKFEDVSSEYLEKHGIKAEVIEQEDPKKKLLEEKERLLVRLAEIEELLK